MAQLAQKAQVLVATAVLAGSLHQANDSARPESLLPCSRFESCNFVDAKIVGAGGTASPSRICPESPLPCRPIALGFSG